MMVEEQNSLPLNVEVDHLPTLGEIAKILPPGSKYGQPYLELPVSAEIPGHISRVV